MPTCACWSRPRRRSRHSRSTTAKKRDNHAYRRWQEYLTADQILRPRPVAYFSAEFGLHGSIPIYSGGLGVLAGDYIKSEAAIGIDGEPVTVEVFTRSGPLCANVWRMKIGRRTLLLLHLACTAETAGCVSGRSCRWELAAIEH